ncbi:MAG: DNA/RNA non-specific endonuclease [Holophagaceae bacterium]|nr:DNA/RNA non-specific endonuclease [Holophagaceae bacterium]
MAGDGGTHNFNVSFNTVGTQTLTATDTGTASINGSQANILVNAGAATHFTLTGYPSPASPGVSNTFTVTALDDQNNTATGYTGSVHFTSTDGAAILPANYTFQPADAGVRTFNATLTTAGTQTLTVTDTVAASITGSSASISVSAVAPSILVQPQTMTVVPPDAVTFTVTAQANNGGTLSYAWKKNGTAIPGETSTSYTVPSTEFPKNTDAYSVTVSEGGLSTDSSSVYALASVPSPAYAGDPVPVPSRPITVLPSLHVDAVKFPNGAFRLGYDEALKNPVWTAYVNFPVSLPYANSTADYTADTRLQAPQVGKTDYNGLYTSGANAPDSYDRGHQVPRADISYRYTPVAGDDATIMSNLVPQISQFNQQTWQKLEDAIGGNGGGTTDGLTSFKGRVWVYTGSVFPASPTWWNSQVTPGLQIAIPVSCYKIVVHEATPGHPEVLAMLMPNVWGLPNNTTTLTSYVTSVARIEALTGLDFFPNLATVAPTLDIPTWKATVDVRGWRTPFEQPTGPNVHVIRPSYDETVDEGTAVAFDGAATPPSGAAVGTTIASTTWNFGDATPTTTGYATTHLYTTAGTYTATFTASDSLGGSNTISRVIRVIPPASNNSAPSTTPALIPDQTTLADQAVTVNFTVADDRTPAGSLLIAASSDNAVLLPISGILASNNSGAASLVLTPAAGQIGSATITVTITDGDASVTTRTFLVTVNAPSANTLTEAFETGTKGSYAAAAVALRTGSWTLTDALIAKSTSNGGSASDHFNGLQGCRIQNNVAGVSSGKVTMGFDYSFGAQTVSISIAQYNTDSATPGTLGLWYSTDQGGSWTQAAGTVTPASTTPVTFTWTVGVNAPIRIELRRTDTISKGRICLDDIVITGY